MQRKILVSYELARWTFAWNVLRKPSANSWVWQPAVRLTTTTRRFINRGDPQITFSWSRSWCHRRSTRPSRSAGADGRRISVHRRSGSRSPVNQPLRCCKVRWADRIGLFSVDQRLRHRSTPTPSRLVASSKTAIPTPTRRAVSIPRGEGRPNCN